MIFCHLHKISDRLFLYQDKLFPVSIPVLRRSDYYNVLEKNKSKDFGDYIAELELQTIKDLMRFLHLELEN